MTVREIDEEIGAMEERKKWIKAIENIKAELKDDIQNGVIKISSGNEYLFSAIDKHTKELM